MRPTERRPMRRPAGRPRDADADRRILQAAVALLAAQGYQALSIEAVAAAANVGRPTIYRRYRSKAALVAAALLELTRGEVPVLPPDPRGALLALLRATAGALGNRGGMTIMGSLLSQETGDPELAAIFREQVFQPRHAVVRDVLERGVAAGEVDAAADLAAAIDLLFGALLARGVLGEPPTDAWLESVVETVWSGISVRR